MFENSENEISKYLLASQWWQLGYVDKLLLNDLCICWRLSKTKHELCVSLSFSFLYLYISHSLSSPLSLSLSPSSLFLSLPPSFSLSLLISRRLLSYPSIGRSHFSRWSQVKTGSMQRWLHSKRLGLSKHLTKTVNLIIMHSNACVHLCCNNICNLQVHVLCVEYTCVHIVHAIYTCTAVVL